MKMLEVMGEYSLSVEQLLNPQKDYLFTCVFDKALKFEKDFIYLPFASNVKDVPRLVLDAIQNSYCKGVIINKKWYQDFKTFFEPLAVNFEFFGLAGNVYNLAYAIAEENSKNLSFKTITVAGTEETSTVKEFLVQAISNTGYRVSYPQPDWSSWQKSIEPLLSSEDNLDYAIIEAIPERAHLTEYAARYYKNNILFTSSKISAMNIWEEMADLSKELLKLISQPERIQSIYTYSDNELVNCGISHELQGRLEFVQDIEVGGFRQDFYCLDRCYNLASAFMINNGIEPVKPSNSVETEPLYYSASFGGCDYFIINPQKVSVNSLKETAVLFSKKYPDRKKIFIYEHITGLGDYKDEVYRDIFAHLAKLNPEVLVLLETRKFKHYFKRYNNQTYVKYFPYKSGDKTKMANIKRFLDGISQDNCAVLVCSKHDLSSIWEDINSEVFC